MTKKNAEQEPQNHRSRPVILEWETPNALPVLIDQPIKEQESTTAEVVDITPVPAIEKRELQLQRAEQVVYEILRGGKTGLMWTVRIGVPILAIGGLAVVLFKGALWIGTWVVAIGTAAMAGMRTAALGFLSLALIAACIMAAIYYHRGTWNQPSQEVDTRTDRSGQSTWDVHIKNDIKLNSRTGEFRINNHISNRRT